MARHRSDHFRKAGRGSEIARVRPAPVRCGPLVRRLVHRKPGTELVLIDWQCPGAGDPVEGLATFLSRASRSCTAARR
jgi:hypothetical protein